MIQVRHQWHWFAKVYVALTEITQLAQTTQHLRQTLFLFGRAAQLFSIGTHFHHVLVTDVNRYQGDRTGAAAQQRLNSHRQRAGFRVQQTAGTGTTAFDKVFNRVAAAEQFAQILTENGGIELIALKGTTNKERAQAAEDRACRPEVQVDTRSDMRRHQPLVIEHVGEQQVVHVAAVAGNINNFVPVVRQLANAFCVVNVNSLIQPVPGEAQNTVGQANHLVREVGGDLFHQRNGVLLRLFMGDFLAARFVFYRAGNRFGGQQLVEEILTRR